MNLSKHFYSEEQRPHWARFLAFFGMQAFGLWLILIGRGMFFDALGRLKIEKEQHTYETISAQVTTSKESQRGECFFKYEYTVAGQALKGNIHSIEEFTPCRGVKQFAVGDIIDIYYDPIKPHNAVVVRENTSAWTQYSFYLVALLLVWTGSYAIFKPYEQLLQIVKKETKSS